MFHAVCPPIGFPRHLVASKSLLSLTTTNPQTAFLQLSWVKLFSWMHSCQYTVFIIYLIEIMFAYMVFHRTSCCHFYLASYSLVTRFQQRRGVLRISHALSGHTFITSRLAFLQLCLCQIYCSRILSRRPPPRVVAMRWFIPSGLQWYPRHWAANLVKRHAGRCNGKFALISFASVEIIWTSKGKSVVHIYIKNLPRVNDL